jgi:hypothetical protein
MGNSFSLSKPPRQIRSDERELRDPCSLYIRGPKLFNPSLASCNVAKFIGLAASAALFATAALTAPSSISPPAGTPSGSVATLAWQAGDNGVQWAEIRFDDLAPPYVSLQQCWNAMGMDNKGRIYIGFTSNRQGGGEDFVVFRYDPASRERLFLGTLVDIAQSAGNLAPGESIPKGHTRLIFVDGKVYMGSQGFHDFKDGVDDLPKYRGAHIFSFDTSSNTWQDLAADFQDGVIVKHQGIVGLSLLRDQNLLVGLTHPYSDLVLFNYKTNQIKKVIPGIPWKLGNPLSREVIVAPSGRIYTYRGTEDPKQRDERHPVWVYDLEKNEMSNTGFEMTQGFWIGKAEKRDGSKTYVSTINGQLYEFDTLSEKFQDLGYLLPKANIEAGRKIDLMYGVTLSPDETKLYYIPAQLENPQGSGELYSYDIATRQVKFVDQLPRGAYTSANLHDGRNIYMAHFGTGDNAPSGNASLIIIKADSP